MQQAAKSNIDVRDIGRTGTGFRRRTMKLSALCIMNRVNWWHSIRSISSACLILILSLMELTDGSMRTRSFSLREMVSGFRSTSFDPLRHMYKTSRMIDESHLVPCFHFWFVVSFHNLDMHGFASLLEGEIKLPETRSSLVSMQLSRSSEQLQGMALEHWTCIHIRVHR